MTKTIDSKVEEGFLKTTVRAVGGTAAFFGCIAPGMASLVGSMYLGMDRIPNWICYEGAPLAQKIAGYSLATGSVLGGGLVSTGLLGGGFVLGLAVSGRIMFGNEVWEMVEEGYDPCSCQSSNGRIKSKQEVK